MVATAGGVAIGHCAVVKIAVFLLIIIVVVLVVVVTTATAVVGNVGHCIVSGGVMMFFRQSFQ